MSEMLLHIGLYISLLVMIWQDLRTHGISWPLLPLLFILSLITALHFLPAKQVGLNFMNNMIFLSLLFAFLFCYVSLKNRKLTNFIDKTVGWGDILFLPSVALLFDPLSFVVAFVVVTALMILVTIVLKGTRAFKAEVPYAGGWSFVLIPVLILRQLGDADLFRDQFYANIFQW